jgi:ABC-type nitrate/sulfonate/bicarbonate transport system substrate-binding protein
MRTRVVIGLWLFLISPRFAAAETINFSTASEAVNTAPLWIAKDLGFFEKYGNSVRLIFIPGASVSIAALVNNDAQMAQLSPMLPLLRRRLPSWPERRGFRC